MQAFIKKIMAWKFARFVVVGCSNALICYVIYIALIHLLSTHQYKGAISEFFGAGVAMIWSYYWNRRWTFNSSNKKRHESVRFVIVQLFILGLSVLIIHALVDRLFINPTLAWVLTTGVTLFVNFTLLKVWVFRPIASSAALESR